MLKSFIMKTQWIYYVYVYAYLLLWFSEKKKQNDEMRRHNIFHVNIFDYILNKLKITVIETFGINYIEG